MTTILVTGSTGKQGSSIITSLLSLPKPPLRIKALTRNPTSPSALSLAAQSPSINLVEGSFSTLQPLLADADAVYLMSENVSAGADGEIAQGVAFTSAIKAHLDTSSKPLHVVYSSVDGANRGTEIPHFESKGKIEEMLKNAVGEKNLTILRPTAFMNNFPKVTGAALFPLWGAFDSVLEGRKIKWVSTRDIGRVGALALTTPAQYGGQAIALAGDELSISDIQDAYFNVNGTRPTKAEMSKAEALKMLPPPLAATLTWISSGGTYEADIEELKKGYPGMYSFEDYLRS